MFKYEIVRISDVKFAGPGGYYMPDGYCFKDPRGYVAFKGKHTPYMPQGGKKALQCINVSGGFESEAELIFLQPMEV